MNSPISFQMGPYSNNFIIYHVSIAYVFLRGLGGGVLTFFGSHKNLCRLNFPTLSLSQDGEWRKWIFLNLSSETMHLFSLRFKVLSNINSPVVVE